MKKFFNESGAKYGLTLDTVISCGSYGLRRWNDGEDSFEYGFIPLITTRGTL